MKFKFKLTNDKTYNEVGQVNPIRWKTLYREDDITFTDQSGWIKCKDFFNDTVAFFKVGSKFSIYGYQNDIKKNEEGVYFLLKEIQDMDSFLSGINVLNVRLFSDLKCELAYWPQEKGQCLLLLPTPVWDSTYVLSLVTMLVRCCNYGYKYEKWDDFYHSQAPMNTVERAFTPTAKQCSQQWGFLVPKEYRKYWWYFNKEHNSEKRPDVTGSAIHNNGVCQWTQGITGKVC